jgi:hypothetical protein
MLQTVTMVTALHSIGQALGFTYEDGAVIPDGTAPTGHATRYYPPTDRPGARFPHMWLDLTRQTSSLDWFDQQFAVVAGPMGDEWKEAGKRVSERIQLPLGLHTLPCANPEDGFQAGLRGAGASRRPRRLEDALASNLSRSRTDAGTREAAALTDGLDTCKMKPPSQPSRTSTKDGNCPPSGGWAPPTRSPFF